MKRCPQCEFIYNDDQNLCDMDGKTLVHDAELETLPNLPVTENPARRSRVKMFTLPAIAGLVLAAVIVIGYYATPQLSAQPEPQAAPASQKIETAVPTPATSEPATTEPSDSTTPEAEDAVEDSEVAAENQDRSATHATRDPRLTIPKGLPPLARVRPLPQLPPAKVTTPRSSTSRTTGTRTEPPKKDSSVKTLLKKTGRILKKPFKF